MSSKQHYKWAANKNTFLTNFNMSDPGTLPVFDAGFDGLPIHEFWTMPEFRVNGWAKMNRITRTEIAPLYWLVRGIVSDASVSVGAISRTDPDGEVFTNTDTYSDSLSDANFGSGLLSLEVSDLGYYPQERSIGIPATRQYTSTYTLPSRQDDDGNELNPNTFRARIIVNTGGPLNLRRLIQASDYASTYNDPNLQGYGMSLGSAFVEVSNASNQDNHSVSKQITISTHFGISQQSESLVYGSKNVVYSTLNILGVPFYKETIEINNVPDDGYISSSMINLGTFHPWLFEY